MIKEHKDKKEKRFSGPTQSKYLLYLQKDVPD